MSRGMDIGVTAHLESDHELDIHRQERGTSVLQIGSAQWDSSSHGTITVFAEDDADLRRLVAVITEYLDRPAEDTPAVTE